MVLSSLQKRLKKVVCCNDPVLGVGVIFVKLSSVWHA